MAQNRMKKMLLVEKENVALEKENLALKTQLDKIEYDMNIKEKNELALREAIKGIKMEFNGFHNDIIDAQKTCPEDFSESFVERLGYIKVLLQGICICNAGVHVSLCAKHNTHTWKVP